MIKLVPILALLLMQSLHASITIDFYVGISRDSSGTAIPDDTLWAMVVDGGDGDLTGIDVSSGNGGSLHSTATPGTFFNANQSLSIGQNIGGGDTVFAMGKYDSSTTGVGGSTGVTLSGLELGSNGLAVGRAYVVYWFPGAVYTGAGSYSIDAHTQNISDEVGGISSIADDGAYGAMIIPADSASELHGAVSADLDSGRWSTTEMTSVLIPEPGTSLLVALGAMLMLRRRR